MTCRVSRTSLSMKESFVCLKNIDARPHVLDVLARHTSYRFSMLSTLLWVIA